MKTKQKLILYIIPTFVIITLVICLFFQYDKKNRVPIEIGNDKTMDIGQSEIVIDSVQEQTTIEQVIKEDATDDIKIKEENTIETETDKGDDTNQAVEPVSLGNFRLTAYCSCSLCCGKWAYNRPTDENGNEIVYGAIEERLQEGYSIAVDPTVIPYRTEVIINGHTYKAQDCGSAIKGNRIDIYMSNHQDALNFGVQYAEVFIMPN